MMEPTILHTFLNPPLLRVPDPAGQGARPCGSGVKVPGPAGQGWIPESLIPSLFM